MAEATSGRGSKKTLIIGGICVVVVAVAAVVILMMTRGGGNVLGKWKSNEGMARLEFRENIYAFFLGKSDPKGLDLPFSSGFFKTSGGTLTLKERDSSGNAAEERQYEYSVRDNVLELKAKQNPSRFIGGKYVRQ